jgi:anaerobic selenocysteine-containing dehydrogenase
MTKFALYVPLEAKPGKEKEVADFLRSAVPLVNAEVGTISWFAIQEGPSSFAIFDTFDDERAPHAQGNFKTPSGKCELKASAAENGNFVVPVWRSMYEAMQSGDPLDPVPDYIPPYESPASNPVLAGRYPLSMVSPKPHAFLNTQYGNEPTNGSAKASNRC